MKITIAKRMYGFSHRMGSCCLIPQTLVELQAFPTLLRWVGHFELSLSLKGPVTAFTLEQDLERDRVRVYGTAQEGFFCLEIYAVDAGFHLVAQRAPAGGIAYQGIEEGVLHRKETLFLPCRIRKSSPKPQERLFLGSAKRFDEEKQRREVSLRDWLPLLFTLSQKIPRIPSVGLKGTGSLLEQMHSSQNDEQLWKHFIQAAFRGLCVPRWIDEEHQGLCPTEEGQGEAGLLIQEAGRKIRDLFFCQKERRVSLLPSLPVSLESGRMTDVQMEGIGWMDWEWRKKLPRRALIRASTSGEILLELPVSCERYRVRSSLKEKGRWHGRSTPLLLEEGKIYFLDRFQK